MRTINPAGLMCVFSPRKGAKKEEQKEEKVAKSSINFQKAIEGGLVHNDRSGNEPDYLLPAEHRLENEVDRSAEEAVWLIHTLHDEAKDNYQQKFGQKLQARSYVWEAVVNLNKNHTMEDVQRLVNEVEEETGFSSVQLAIHRDEGRMERGVPIYNFHAHLTFFTLSRETGEQLYRRQVTAKQKARGIEPMDRERLSKLQDITAAALGMVRGQRGSKSVRMSHKQFKAAKQEEMAKIKDIQSENRRLRAQLKEIGAGREEYAQLEAVIRELKEQAKAKDLTIQELHNRLRDTIKTAEQIRIERDREIFDLKREIGVREGDTPIGERIAALLGKLNAIKRSLGMGWEGGYSEKSISENIDRAIRYVDEISKTTRPKENAKAQQNDPTKKNDPTPSPAAPTSPKRQDERKRSMKP